MQIDPERLHEEALDACGRAFGFIFAMALADPAAMRTKAGVLAFAGQLGDFCDAERFSPDVTLVMSGVIGGLSAAAALTAQSDGEIV
jgi:hypothetical protein